MYPPEGLVIERLSDTNHVPIYIGCSARAALFHALVQFKPIPTSTPTPTTTMFGAFRPTSPLSSGVLWYLPPIT